VARRRTPASSPSRSGAAGGAAAAEREEKGPAIKDGGVALPVSVEKAKGVIDVYIKNVVDRQYVLCCVVCLPAPQLIGYCLTVSCDVVLA
jgi:hypothetical protein